MTFSISPVKAAHSIDACALLLHLAKPLSQKEMAELADQPCPFFEGMQKKIEKKKGKLSLEISLQKEQDLHPSWRIVMIRETISIMCCEYSRWSDFIEAYLQIIGILLEKFTHREIYGISLGVLDVFKVSAENNFDLTNLFKKSSPFINQSFLNSQLPPALSACHTTEYYSGEKWDYYKNDVVITASKKHNHKEIFFEIDNFNLLASYKEQFKIEELHKNSPDWIRIAAQFMHDKNKKTISMILNDAVLDRIGLRRESYAAD